MSETTREFLDQLEPDERAELERTVLIKALTRLADMEFQRQLLGEQSETPKGLLNA